MNDWKSALKALKKEMFGVKDESDEPKKESKSGVSSLAHKQANKLHVSRFPTSELRNKEAEVKTTKYNQQLAKSKVQLQRQMEAKVAPNPLPIQRDQVQTPQPKPLKLTGVPNKFQIPTQTRLTRQDNFKYPDAWVLVGSATQLTTTRLPGSAIDVYIGLDFGTSYTKAAVGLKDQVFVVDWEGVSTGSDRYLLPSEYSIMPDGSCQIGQAPGVPFDQVRQYLKHPLIDAAVSTSSIANAAVFLALVLRYVRAWVFCHHGEKLGGSSIRWMLNIGAPSNGLESERHRYAYLNMCSSAWSMSVSESGASAIHAGNLVKTWQPEAMPQDLIGLDVLPEFVAQISGYVQSAQRQRGLHALVDVGGGTLDVVTFIVHERDGEDIFPFLVPEIRTLGTQMLYQNRLVGAPEHDKAKLPDELQPVLNSSEYAKCTGLPEEHIAQRDGLFWGEVHGTVHRVFHQTKRKRYRLSEAWTTELPIFLTGGGGSVEGYKKSIQTGGQYCAPVMNMMLLPKHPKLAEYSGSISDYQRVSVACGLAQDAFSLGRLIPAGQVEDDSVEIPLDTDRFDHDELYAR